MVLLGLSMKWLILFGIVRGVKMRLKDLIDRKIIRVKASVKILTCWECTNQILPNNNEEKKRVIFEDKSQVILCLGHFVKLVEIQKL